MKRKIFSVLAAVGLSVTLAIPAFAYGNHTTIRNQREVESNDTEDTANIVPFNGTSKAWYARMDHQHDDDYFIFTLGEDKTLSIKLQRQTKMIDHNFFIWIYDKTTGETIHSESLSMTERMNYFPSFQGEAGHTYAVNVCLEGNLDAPLAYSKGYGYSIFVNGK